jgi:ankyrin repeat protein
LCSFCVQGGRTPLHLACIYGAVGLVSELLAAGAQVDAQDKVSELDLRSDVMSGYLCLQNGKLPIHYACECGRVKTVLLLFEAGADFFEEDEVEWPSYSLSLSLSLSWGEA